MSRPNGILEDDNDRSCTARAVRSVKKADPSLSVIDKLRLIVRDNQANRVNGVLVDLFSASVVVQVYEAVNDVNKARLLSLPVRHLVDVCYKVANTARAKS